AGFSSPWTEVLRWDPLKPFLDQDLGAWRRWIKDVPSYVDDITVLNQYDAVWIDAGAANVATVNPNPPSGRTVQFQRGWNNFVYTGSAKQVDDALAQAAGKYE